MRTTGQTGVEMEALTAAAVAALTVYDMCKSVDRGMRIEAVRRDPQGGRQVRGVPAGSERGQAMISVEEARGAHPGRAAPVAGRNRRRWPRPGGGVTAAPVVARLTQPPADVSAMDGYALRAADGEAGAASAGDRQRPGGAPVRRAASAAARRCASSPAAWSREGADAILLQEDATRDGEIVRVNETVHAAATYAAPGRISPPGEVVIPAGRRLTARDVGLAAAANHPWITVHRRPRIAMLATGDEIAHAGRTNPAGRHRQFQFARFGRPGARGRRRAAGAAGRAGRLAAIAAVADAAAGWICW